jgi:hypothetical protein
MRLFSAKPTSVPVERCWSAFGDVLSAKRRCMHKGRLARLVHARANMHFLECDSLEPGAETDASAFLSVYEAVGDMDEEEDAARVFAAKALQEDDLHVHDDDAVEESISFLLIQTMGHRTLMMCACKEVVGVSKNRVGSTCVSDCCAGSCWGKRPHENLHVYPIKHGSQPKM